MWYEVVIVSDDKFRASPPPLYLTCCPCFSIITKVSYPISNLLGKIIKHTETSTTQKFHRQLRSHSTHRQETLFNLGGTP